MCGRDGRGERVWEKGMVAEVRGTSWGVGGRYEVYRGCVSMWDAAVMVRGIEKYVI